MPGPRTMRPACWTSTRRGGSHLVMTIVSSSPTCRPPGRGGPVRGASRPPTPCAEPPTVRTSVASIHSPWEAQSVSTSHTRSGGASMSIRSTTSGIAVLSVGGAVVRRCWRRYRPRLDPGPERGDLGIPFVQGVGELVQQPVDLGHAVPAEGHRDPERPHVVARARPVLGQLHGRTVQLGRRLGLTSPEQHRRAEEEQPADDQDADDEDGEGEHVRRRSGGGPPGPAPRPRRPRTPPPLGPPPPPRRRGRGAGPVRGRRGGWGGGGPGG